MRIPVTGGAGRVPAKSGDSRPVSRRSRHSAPAPPQLTVANDSFGTTGVPNESFATLDPRPEGTDRTRPPGAAQPTRDFAGTQWGAGVIGSAYVRGLPAGLVPGHDLVTRFAAESPVDSSPAPPSCEEDA